MIILNKEQINIIKESINLNKNVLIDSIINDIENNVNIDENIELEVLPSDVTLGSFKIQDELHHKIWVNNLINSRVRLKLLDIADDFIDTLEVDWAKPKDIVLTGSLCNYNWSNESDIDLHIIYNFKDIDKRVDFVKEYMDSKKKIWNDEHDALKIYGFPVELYVENEGEEHTSSGIYSLEENKWLVKPNKDNFKNNKIDKTFIRNKASKIMTEIDKLIDLYSTHLGEYESEQLNKKVIALWKKIKSMRKTGLNRGGEMDSYNIIFKVLKRTDYIEKLLNLKTKTYDLMSSLK